MQSNPDIERLFERFPNKRRTDLIPLLQCIQDETGYLSQEAIHSVATYLNISVNKIFGVATFYDNFVFGPVGRHHIRLCHGTACHVMGSGTLLRELEKLLKISDGETDKEGFFSLEVVSCLGACGLAPLVEINGSYHTQLNLNNLKQLIQSLRDQETVHP